MVTRSQTRYETPPAMAPEIDPDEERTSRSRSADRRNTNEVPIDPTRGRDAAVNEEEQERDSDYDAEITDGEHSAYAGQPEFDAPTTSNLIYLGVKACRVPTHKTSSDGKKISCACGRPASICQQHKRHREDGRHRHAVGHYKPFANPAQGRPNIHGIALTFVPERESNAGRDDLFAYASARKQESAQESDVDSDSERQVRFKSPSPQLKTWDPEAERLRGELAGDTKPKAKKSKSKKQQEPSEENIETLWCLLTDLGNNRLILRRSKRRSGCSH